jgi:AraC-like DNA-binding protein
VQHEPYRSALAVSTITPPYAGFGRAADVDSIRPSDLCPGAIFGVELGDEPHDPEMLKAGLLRTRQRFPAVPIVLRLPRDLDVDAAYLIQVTARLHVRGVVVEGDPIRETLRRFLTDPVDLAADVVEWLSLRRPALPPHFADLVRKIFLHARTRAAMQRFFTEIGESTRTARARCQKLAVPPPGKWLQAARAIHAALCLQRSQSTSLLAVATEFGYSDHSALSHQLVRMFGAGPSAIRRTLGWEWLLDSWLARWPVRARVRS